MGAGNGWYCKSCGVEEYYPVGAGLMSLNVEETRECIARGEFGEIARQLLSKDFPLDVNTVDEHAFYRCPECGKLIGGGVVRFFVGKDDFELMLPVVPEECPACGARFEFVDDRKPVSEREIDAYVAEILESGCPNCGSKDVHQLAIMWD
ncbi:MAG: hypothetical protein K6G78_00385 [bacterium]|nr:hypothetical protein [bacterium]